MYQIFKTKQEAKERSLIEAMRRGCDLVLSKYWWSEPVPFKDGYATDVKDGNGLSKDELAACIEYLPNQKLYFSTAKERDAFNAAEAEFAGASPSLPYFKVGKDENGYYLLLDVIAKPNLWNRFKNWF